MEIIEIIKKQIEKEDSHSNCLEISGGIYELKKFIREIEKGE